MEKEFIPYEQALSLKELGFESPYPIGGYQGGKVFYYEKGELYYDGRPMYSSDNHSGQLLAPLYQQVFRWFREKCNIQATIEPTKDQHRFELGFNYWIWNTKTAEEWFTEPRDRPAGDYVFDTYEEAELECLKKLIEIVKNK
jgi:hypothetical protein